MILLQDYENRNLNREKELLAQLERVKKEKQDMMSQAQAQDRLARRQYQAQIKEFEQKVGALELDKQAANKTLQEMQQKNIEHKREQKMEQKLQLHRKQAEEEQREKEEDLARKAHKIEELEKKVQESENLGETNEKLKAELRDRQKEFENEEQTNQQKLDNLNNQLIVVMRHNSDGIQALTQSYAETVSEELRIPIWRGHFESGQSAQPTTPHIPCRQISMLTPRLEDHMKETMKDMAENHTTKFQKVVLDVLLLALM